MQISKCIIWTARIWSAASLLLILGFIVGEGVHLNTRQEIVGFVLYPAGISAGMLIAWWRERLGGTLTVASFTAFYILYFVNSGTFPKGWAWLILAFPGFLFLLHPSRFGTHRSTS